MTKVDLTEAQRLTESATPGPWTTDLHSHGAYLVGPAPGGRPGGEVIGDLNPSRRWDGYPVSAQHANAEFIAWCRTAVPGLIGELTEARQQLETAQAQFDRSGELFRQQLVRTAQANVRGDEVEATIERVRALCDEAIAGTVIQPDGWALDPHAIRAALGAAVNGSSTEATQWAAALLAQPETPEQP